MEELMEEAVQVAADEAEAHPESDSTPVYSIVPLDAGYRSTIIIQ